MASGSTALAHSLTLIRLCILLCSAVVLMEVSSFKVCRVLCKDVTDRVVCVCVISKVLLCCILPGHFQVSALYRSLLFFSFSFFTEAMFSREFLLSRRYARGVERDNSIFRVACSVTFDPVRDDGEAG